MLLNNSCTLVLTDRPGIEQCSVHRCAKRYRRTEGGKLEEIDSLEQSTESNELRRP